MCNSEANYFFILGHLQLVDGFPSNEHMMFTSVVFAVQLNAMLYMSAIGTSKHRSPTVGGVVGGGVVGGGVVCGGVVGGGVVGGGVVGGGVVGGGVVGGGVVGGGVVGGGVVGGPVGMQIVCVTILYIGGENSTFSSSM